MIGNCLLKSLKGYGDCEGDIDILGMYTLWPGFLPEIISAAITCLASLVSTNLVPLHEPCVWSKFLSNIIGLPIFSLIRYLADQMCLVN